MKHDVCISRKVIGDDNWFAQCSCGWKTSKLQTQRGAKRSATNHHMRASKPRKRRVIRPDLNVGDVVFDVDHPWRLGTVSKKLVTRLVVDWNGGDCDTYDIPHSKFLNRFSNK